MKQEKILIFVLLMIVVALFSYTFIISHYKEKKDCKPDRDWLINNCKCVEWEGELSCPAGFELRNESCWKNKTLTNTLVSCSKYKCPEYFVEIE